MSMDRFEMGEVLDRLERILHGAIDRLEAIAPQRGRFVVLEQTDGAHIIVSADTGQLVAEEGLKGDGVRPVFVVGAATEIKGTIFDLLAKLEGRAP